MLFGVVFEVSKAHSMTILSISLCVSLCQSLCLCLSLCLTVCLSLSLSLSLYLLPMDQDVALTYLVYCYSTMTAISAALFPVVVIMD